MGQSSPWRKDQERITLACQSIAKLIELMAQLRGPEGCPWDRAQDYNSLKPLLLEEAYEVIDAMNSGDFDALRDELGDLLFQVVFLARLAEEDGRFDFDSVADSVHSKLVRRHPHVFGDERAATPEEALQSWNAAKQAAKQKANGRSADSPARSILDGTAPGVPATLQAHELGLRAAGAGFDWKAPADVLRKAEEEILEIKQEVAKSDPRARACAREEIGDLLFTLANLARHLDTDIESCLRAANQKFRQRLRALESAAARRNRKISECSLEELEQMWQSSKAAEKP